MSERVPDGSDGDRDAGTDRDVGQGYPEENQPGTSPGEHPTQRPDPGATAPESPDTRSEQDGEPSEATGNRGAAGG